MTVTLNSILFVLRSTELNIPGLWNPGIDKLCFHWEKDIFWKWCGPRRLIWNMADSSWYMAESNTILATLSLGHPRSAPLIYRWDSPPLPHANSSQTRHFWWHPGPGLSESQHLGPCFWFSLLPAFSLPLPPPPPPTHGSWTDSRVESIRQAVCCSITSDGFSSRLEYSPWPSGPPVPWRLTDPLTLSLTTLPQLEPRWPSGHSLNSESTLSTPGGFKTCCPSSCPAFALVVLWRSHIRSLPLCVAFRSKIAAPCSAPSFSSFLHGTHSLFVYWYLLPMSSMNSGAFFCPVTCTSGCWDSAWPPVCTLGDWLTDGMNMDASAWWRGMESGLAVTKGPR